jgi:hypothetical protein
MLIDPAKFQLRLQSYSQKYPCYEMDSYDFHRFWKWKIAVEAGKGNILDDSHRNDTFNKLRKALPKWKTYRPFSYGECLKALEVSLGRIADTYERIRNYDLLEFSKVSVELLKLIWHELGRAKERNGAMSSEGYYYIVAVSKPLLFLWGQTLAFDSIVRSNIPRFGIHSYLITNTRWSFETWVKTMGNFSNLLHNQPDVIDVCRKEAETKYGKDCVVPYGRFLDIYYYY